MSAIAGATIGEELRSQPLLSRSVIALLLVCALLIGAGTILGLANFTDVGYPDSATLLRVGEVIHSGQIYPDIDRPPYLVTLYGPLTYLLLAVPYRLSEATGVNPQVPVRLGIAGALCACVLLIFLISGRLYGSRPLAWLCSLFAMSALPLAYWSTQIRGDFLALGFSLLSLYLCLRGNRGLQWAGAAVCAGLAVLTKPTFLAAPIAIVAWLIGRRRYREAAFWAAGFAITAAGGYAAVWWHDPLMPQHFAALRHPVLEYPWALRISVHALAEPVTLLAIAGVFLVPWKGSPERLLLLIYCALAWLIALITIPQVGGNINYFWEPLLVSAVIAGPGLCELQLKANLTPKVALLFLLLLPMPLRDMTYILAQDYNEVSGYWARKARWQSFVSVISGRRLLSTFPAVTAFSSIPEIPDPYLNSVLEIGGQWNFSPVAAEIDASVFDLVVIGKGKADYPGGHRGIRIWNDRMWESLKMRYGPACAIEDMEVWLPRRDSSEILSKLSAIGCLTLRRQVDGGSGVVEGNAR